MTLQGASFVGFDAGDTASIKPVYANITTALKRGYAVTYDRETAAALDQNGDAIALTAKSWGRAFYVKKPATADLKFFAGVVTQDKSANANGWYMSILEPDARGVVTEVWTDKNCTAGDILAIGNGSHVFQAAASGLLSCARCIQTVDRSSTNGLVQAILYPVDPWTNALT